MVDKKGVGMLRENMRKGMEEKNKVIMIMRGWKEEIEVRRRKNKKEVRSKLLFEEILGLCLVEVKMIEY